MRGIAGLMALLGGGVCLLGLAFVERSHASSVALATAGIAYTVVGVVLLVAPPRRWLLEAAVFAAIVILSALIAASDPIGMAPIFYMWPVAFGAYFMPRPQLLAVFMVSVVGVVVALLVNRNGHGDGDTVIGVVSSVGLVAWLMDRMNGRERQLRVQLRVNADTDPLTGLLNRRAFDPLLVELAQAPDGEHPLCLVMFDLDHFKRFNDDHGHLVGDEALRRLATVLRQHSRHDDPVVRFGGEEFAILMPGADVARAVALAERVASGLAASGESDWGLTVSSGIAISTTGDDGRALLARADAALYAAKKAGRNRAAIDADGVHTTHPFDPVA